MKHTTPNHSNPRIDRLIKSNKVAIKTKAAAYCLSLNYNIDYAVSTLQEIAENPDNGIFGFNAEMTLKVWKKWLLNIIVIDRLKLEYDKNKIIKYYLISYLKSLGKSNRIYIG